MAFSLMTIKCLVRAIDVGQHVCMYVSMSECESKGEILRRGRDNAAGMLF